jgi:hypothetical protein
MLYNGKYLYAQDNELRFIWYSNTTLLGFEANRWIVSAGLLSDGGTSFDPAGTLNHWTSVSDNATVYLGNYNPVGIATGTVVVAQS